MKHCPNCEYHKQRAQLWRHEAYKLSGHPLDWEPDLMQRTWAGLSDEDWDEIFGNALTIGEAIKVTEAKLRSKNGY